MEHIQIDVEEPNRPTQVISLEDAVEIYALDDLDIRTLKTAGGIVWYKDVALTLHRDDEE